MLVGAHTRLPRGILQTYFVVVQLCASFWEESKHVATAHICFLPPAVWGCCDGLCVVAAAWRGAGVPMCVSPWLTLMAAAKQDFEAAREGH